MQRRAESGSLRPRLLLSQNVDSLLDGAPSPDEPFLGVRRLGCARFDRFPQPLKSQISDLLGDSREPLRNIMKLISHA